MSGLSFMSINKVFLIITLSLLDGNYFKSCQVCCLLFAFWSVDPSQAALYDLSSKYFSSENAHFNRYRASNK